MPTGTIRDFNQKLFDNTNSFDQSTGHFKAPVKGIYVFFVTAMVGKGTTSAIYLETSSFMEKWFNDKDDNGNERQVTISISFALEKDEQVWLYNKYADTIYSSYCNEFT